MLVFVCRKAPTRRVLPRAVLRARARRWRCARRPRQEGQRQLLLLTPRRPIPCTPFFLDQHVLADHLCFDIRFILSPSHARRGDQHSSRSLALGSSQNAAGLQQRLLRLLGSRCLSICAALKSRYKPARARGVWRKRQRQRQQHRRRAERAAPPRAATSSARGAPPPRAAPPCLHSDTA